MCLSKSRPPPFPPCFCVLVEGGPGGAMKVVGGGGRFMTKKGIAIKTVELEEQGDGFPAASLCT